MKRKCPTPLVAVLSNIALCYIYLNDFPQALGFHQKARKHRADKAISILVAYADHNIGCLHFLRGQYGRAIKMQREPAALILCSMSSICRSRAVGLALILDSYGL